jgi:predicted metal-dependent hydrolase
MFARLTKRLAQLPDTETVTIDGLPIACKVVRSRRKSLAVHVRHDQVEVRAPLFVDREEVLRFLDRHRGWVLRRWRDRQQRQLEKLDLRDGGQVYYQARQLVIELHEAARPAVSVSTGGQLQVMRISGPELGPHAADRNQRAAAVLQKWLQASAKAYLPARTRALADYLGVGHKLKDVVFRKTRSKWGHCTARGVIQYNWLIMLAPAGVVDYMISHEVCHLLHMNHSAQYWQSVASVCPDYQRYVGWLKQHEHRLWF